MTSPEEVVALATYRVPRITEEGTCGKPGDLEPLPFDILRQVHGIEWVANEVLSPAANLAVVRLRALRNAMAALAKACAADWAGVYRVVVAPGSSGERTLVKEAYVGAPSRAYFPLTPEFAAGSNNSTVGLAGEAVVITDTRKISDDVPYYSCDGAVRSELCAPIVDSTGAVIGIIDVEAFQPALFDDVRIGIVLDLCAQLGDAHMLLHMLDQ